MWNAWMRAVAQFHQFDIHGNVDFHNPRKWPTVMIHPDDMAVLGLEDGDRVRVGNRRGDILVHASRFVDMQPGIVIIENVRPNSAYEEGLGVNAMIGADAAPPLGGAVFRDSAVWLRSV